MRILLRCGILLLVGCLASCANQAVKNVTAIDLGASKDDVYRLLGQPQNRQFKDKYEAWQYCQTEFVNDSFILLWFYDNKVTGVNTYRDSVNDIGLCSSHFKTINWQDAPDVTVEIRQR